MAAATKNIEIEKGSKFSYPFYVKNSSDNSVFALAGYTAKAQVRETPSSTAVLAELDTAIVEVSGLITLSITKAATALLAPGVFHWDCRIASSSDSRYFLTGRATITQTVTR